MAELDITRSHIVSWEVHHSLEGGASAVVQLADSNGVYSKSDELIKSHQTINYSSDFGAVIIPVFRGYVISAEPHTEVVREEIKIELGTYFTTLQDKAVYSEKFETEEYRNIVASILSTYAAIDNVFINVATANNTEADALVVNEPSILNAVRLLAQVIDCEVYVDHLGRITIDDCKTLDDYVLDWTLSLDRISKMDFLSNDGDGVSVVRVRGKYISYLDVLGLTEIFNDDVTFTPSADIVDKVVTVELNRVLRTGSVEGTVATASAGVTATVIALIFGGGGFNRIKVKLHKNTGVWTKGSTVVVNLVVEAYLIPEHEARSFSNNFSNSAKGSTIQAVAAISAAVDNRSKFIPVIEDKNQRTPIEKEESRIEDVIADSDLVVEHGVRWSEIDNVYAREDTQLTSIAERFFVKLKQARKRWRIEMAPQVSGSRIPRVNEYVLFTSTRTNHEIKGVIIETVLTYHAGNAEALHVLMIDEIERTEIA